MKEKRHEGKKRRRTWKPLTKSEARKVRRLYEARHTKGPLKGERKYSQYALAKKFHVSQPAINGIVNNHTHKEN